MKVTHVQFDSVELGNAVPGHRNSVVWEDELTIGTVPKTSSLDEFSRIRSHDWTELSVELEMEIDDANWFEDEEEKIKLDGSWFSERDRQISELKHADEVVIWAGPTRCEILMLCAILHFTESHITSKQKLNLAYLPSWGTIGCYSSLRLTELFEQRFPISNEDIVLARALWDGFTAPDPAGLNILWSQIRKTNHYLAKALVWTLEEYPSLSNGLSQTEQRLLINCNSGDSISHIAAKTVGGSEDSISFQLLFAIIGRLCSGPFPLFEVVKSEETPEVVRFSHICLRRTALGDKVLQGEVDYVALHGVDRWIGGSYLRGHEVPWRYDTQRRILVRS